MLTAVGLVVVVALAPPVFAWVGGFGDGRTPLAVASPLLATTMMTLKFCPRLSRLGMVRLLTVSCGGAWTVAVLELALAALTAAPELASVPLAPAPSASVPAPEPFSVKFQMKVA